MVLTMGPLSFSGATKESIQRTFGYLQANKEKLGVLDPGLYEFKSFQIRMPFAYAKGERRLVLVTHGFYKKRNKAPKEEIERAWRIFREDQQQVHLRSMKKRQK